MLIAQMFMRNLQRGMWVTARGHRVAEPDYGRITDIDLKAKTIKVMWFSTATEDVHSIVPRQSGDDPRTRTMEMATEDAVLEFVRRKSVEANELVTQAHRNLTEAEDAKHDLQDRIAKVFG